MAFHLNPTYLMSGTTEQCEEEAEKLQLCCILHSEKYYKYCQTCYRPICPRCVETCKNHPTVELSELEGSIIPRAELINLFKENPGLYDSLPLSFVKKRRKLECCVCRTSALINNISIKCKNSNVIQSNDAKVLQEVHGYICSQMSRVMTEQAKETLVSLAGICNSSSISLVEEEVGSYSTQQYMLGDRLGRLRWENMCLKEKEVMSLLLPYVSMIKDGDSSSGCEYIEQSDAIGQTDPEEIKGEEDDLELEEDEELLIIYHLYGDIIPLISNTNPDGTLFIPSSDIDTFEAFRGAKYLWYVQKMMKIPSRSFNTERLTLTAGANTISSASKLSVRSWGKNIAGRIKITGRVELPLGYTGDSVCQLALGAEGVLGCHFFEKGKGKLRFVDLKSGRQVLLDESQDIGGVTSIAFYRRKVFLFTSGTNYVRYALLEKLIDLPRAVQHSSPSRTPSPCSGSPSAFSVARDLTFAAAIQITGPRCLTTEMAFDRIMETEVLNWCDTSRAASGTVFYAAWGPVKHLSLITFEITQLNTAKAVSAISMTGLKIPGVVVLYTSLEYRHNSESVDDSKKTLGTDGDDEEPATPTAVYTLRALKTDNKDVYIRTLSEAGTLCIPSRKTPGDLSKLLVLDYNHKVTIGSKSVAIEGRFEPSRGVSMVRIFKDVFIAANRVTGKIECVRLGIE